MRKIIIWLALTAAAVALLIGYQVGFAGTGDEGKGGDRTGGDTTVGWSR